MAEESKPATSQSRLFVLALGMLIGFVIGFVFLLSRLPVDSAISSFNAADVEPVSIGEMDFDYYSVLPEQKAARKPPAELSIQKATVLSTDTEPKVSPSRTERSQGALQRSRDTRLLPAGSSSAQTAYFLQAGTYQRATDAERARIELLRLGLDAIVVIRQDSSGAIGHRVRVGPFYDQAGLSAARTRLKNGGIRYQTIRVTG